MFEGVRFALNFLTALFLLSVCNRLVLRLAMVTDCFLSVIVLAYSHYFHHPMNIAATLAIGEGSRVRSVGIRQLSPLVWAALVAMLALKLLWAGWITPQPARGRRWLAMGCLGAEALALIALQFTSFNIAHFRSNDGNRSVFSLGYLTAWTGEVIWGPDMRGLAQQLRQLQSVSPDRLNGSEGAWPLGSRIAVVQMESIGWNVLNLKINGQEVTPYLNRLARSSRLFRIQAYHNVGSADMDYAVLSDGTPCPTVISYGIPGISYTNALPRFMKKHGFHTVAFHGNDGSFFDRRPNFARMGFDELWFKEDFRGKPVAMSYWGVRDGDIFDLSSKKMRQSHGPEFHFLITLDTHAPFDFITDAEKEVFPHSTDWAENYFNSLRVLDHKLQRYVESLPEGTLVILYGDHTAGVTYGDYHSDREGRAEFVPCIVHICGPDTSWVAAADPPAGLPKDLRVHDVINEMRHQIQKDWPVASLPK